MPETIHVDYLVIGAGAMGMAFVDTLVSDTQATVALIDRYDRPGGHWTLAYPFVRLHQPSAFYGVNSRPLGQDKIDVVGWNQGLAELASGDEVRAYYSSVMQQTFLPSGRVEYFPKHEYLGGGQFRSLVTHKVFRLGSETTIVDATCMKVKVPAMGPPSFQVASEVDLVTPNEMAKTTRPYSAYTVVGAGKTGVDACLWLLAHGVDPQDITWVMPRDSWFLERSSLQPGARFAQKTAASHASVDRSIMSASSAEDCFLRLEAAQQMLRIDKSVWPTMFRCATISMAELEQLQRIRNVIRQGRVLTIDAGRVTLEKGAYRPTPDTLYIDCTADAIAKLAPVPVFEGRHINLQPVRYCQQVFSAAFMAHIETSYADEALKNELCTVVPHPSAPIDYLAVSLLSYRNALRWSQHPKTEAWLSNARLDWWRAVAPPPPQDAKQADEFYAAVGAHVEGLCAKLEELVAQGYEERHPPDLTAAGSK